MLLAALATALSLSAPSGAAAPPLTIVEPSHGDRLRGVVHVATSVPGDATSVFFEWSRNGGRTWLTIGEDATAYDGFAVDWDTRGFDGAAIVRATDSAARQTHLRLTIDNTAPRVSLVAPAVFSPNGDGVRDRAEVRVSADEIVSMTLQVVSPRRRVVYTQARDVSLPGQRARRLVWHGRLYSGEVRAPDGVYALRAVALDAVGHRVERAVAVRVDTRAPRVVLRRLAPERSAGAAPVQLSFSAGDAGRRLRVRPVLYDVAEEPLRTYAVRAATPGVRSVTLVPGDLVPGTYAAGVVVTDEAGNTTISASRRFLLVRPAQARVWGRFAGAGLRAALTFDDCNDSSSWVSILDTLERLQVTATFFCSGR